MEGRRYRHCRPAERGREIFPDGRSGRCAGAATANGSTRESASLTAVVEEIEKRDKNDSEQELPPLKPAGTCRYRYYAPVDTASRRRDT
jgi:hypothetical protein